jgi:hypothetical protein
MTKKEFALNAIAPYVANPELCGYEDNSCVYLTSDGKMCVAGKYMVNPAIATGRIRPILNNFPQSQVFKPEAVDIFTTSEWSLLQDLHDTLATKFREIDSNFLRYTVNDLGLFTYEELLEKVQEIKETSCT